MENRVINDIEFMFDIKVIVFIKICWVFIGEWMSFNVVFKNIFF